MASRMGDQVKSEIEISEPLKKFIVFAWDSCYPAGGLGDIHSSYDTLDEAKTFADKNLGAYYGQIVDRDTWEEVHIL